MRSWAGASNASPGQPNMAGADDMNDKLNSVRMKLEERRKRIEEEKRKMDLVMSRQGREKGQGGNNTSGYLSPDTSALGSSWLSEKNKSQPATPTAGSQFNDHNRSNDPYNSKYNSSMNLAEPELDGQRNFATQQSQIQRMMQNSPHGSPHGQQPYIQSPPQQPQNPMDPQPFYITGDSPHHPPVQPQPPPPHQRRTWGQPQPINFGQNPMYGGPRPMYGGPQYPQYDQYGNQIIPRDQWGNPLPPQGQYPGQYNGQYQDQYGGYGQPPQYNPYAPQPFYGQQQQQQYGQQQYGPPQTFSPVAAPGGPNNGPRTPFRLHESSPGPGGMMTPNNRSTYDLTDPTNMSTPRQGAFSRHASREHLGQTPASELQTRRLHTSVPAPAADDMAPQNVSFIDNSTDNDDDNEDKSKSNSPDPVDTNSSYQEPRSDSNLSERLKKLNINRGDKTYRIQLHADGREPTALDSDSSSVSNRPSSRPTISSTFKERRRESGDSSGPGSMSGMCELVVSHCQVH